jgi:hypothetical protein
LSYSASPVTRHASRVRPNQFGRALATPAELTAAEQDIDEAPIPFAYHCQSPDRWVLPAKITGPYRPDPMNSSPADSKGTLIMTTTASPKAHSSSHTGPDNATAPTFAQFERDWRVWHAGRERELLTEHGWLSLTWFGWLGEEPVVRRVRAHRWGRCSWTWTT